MDHYGKARRDGLRIYTAALQAHEDPYLPVLESKVPELASLSRLSLGIMAIPLSRVMGSVSMGRSRAFTKNFLPILDGGSEFAAKWDRLYESVEAEGVNMPITALEYMGLYYVIEGNKRVSVMKAMEAEDIEADVTRVLPEHTNDPDVIAYYEYCDFTKETGLYNILFSRPGRETGNARRTGRSGDRASRISCSHRPRRNLALQKKKRPSQTGAIQKKLK